MFWDATLQLGWPFGPLLRLLLLTGQRESEVAGLRWSELDIPNRVWDLPGMRTKNGKAHIIHLSDLRSKSSTSCPDVHGQRANPTTCFRSPAMMR